VQRALILFGLSLSAGCGARAPTPPTLARPLPKPVVFPPPRVEATSCRAEPGTVYGDEPVAFTVEAPSATVVEGELFEASGRSLGRETLPAPGTWRPAQLPSGDFTLQLAGGTLRCSVTVNRELPRATQAKR
jgi:hypothetical protein